MIPKPTLCPGNYAVLSRRQPANSLTLWILAEATDQEETRVAEKISLLKMIRNGGSGSQLSADKAIRSVSLMTAVYSMLRAKFNSDK